MLLRDEFHSVMSVQLIDISFLGTSARAGQMGASGDYGYLSSYYRRRGILPYSGPGLIYRSFQSWLTSRNSIPRILSQRSSSDECLDLILQMSTIVSVVANVVVESTELRKVPLGLLVLQRLRFLPREAGRVG